MKEDEIKNDDTFRSPHSDIEVPKTRKRVNDSCESLASKLDPLAVTKENMSTSRRPADSDFTQQRLFGWQPILTPYNVLPVLFILGLIFVPLGIVFLTASMGVQDVTIDYTKDCRGRDVCEVTVVVPKTIKAPVAVYYRLTNFYQNNRLYAMSKSDAQLKGAAITDPKLLKECAPLDKSASGQIYYPCGLIANSYFTDEFSTFKTKDGTKEFLISPEQIAWPGDSELYGKTEYTEANVDAVLPPPAWQKARIMGINADGKYIAFPNLAKDERFQNWMKISGLPTFRKLYGRIYEDLEPGEYKLTVKGDYDVSTYSGTKSFVISSTNWAGGKNNALGLGFIAVGGLLLLLGLIFLVMFMMAPRKVGDVSYLSWYAEHSGDPLAEAPVNEEE